jgi:hypothetical protein
MEPVRADLPQYGAQGVDQQPALSLFGLRKTVGTTVAVDNVELTVLRGWVSGPVSTCLCCPGSVSRSVWQAASAWRGGGVGSPTADVFARGPELVATVRGTT